MATTTSSSETCDDDGNAPTGTTTTANPENTHTRDFQKEKGNDDDDNNNRQRKQHQQPQLDLGLGEKSWRSLLEVSMARSRKIRGSNYVQLATVDTTTNEPRCRTVVFRGFQKVPDDTELSLDHHKCDDLSTVLKMCTDSRSKKVGESSAGEIVWWFPKSNEQYRFNGQLLYVGGADETDDDNDNDDKSKLWKLARKELWGNLSDAARESFFDPKVPGQPIPSDKEEGTEVPALIPKGGRDAETGKVLPPPDCFLLMLLFPHHVDYLNLKENYRQIDVLDNNKKEWSFQTVNA